MSESKEGLRPYMVEIQHPNTFSRLGRGFICHPDGTILTCWHVIAACVNDHSPPDAVDMAVILPGNEEPVWAELLRQYSVPEADIAVLRLKNSAGNHAYLCLHTHWSIHLDDALHSFGYPAGTFEKDGVSTSLKIASA